MFNGMVLPNQCKKCEVIEIATGQIVHVEEGCGSENVRLDEKAKVKAYDLNTSSNGYNYTVECNSWKSKD